MSEYRTSPVFKWLKVDFKSKGQFLRHGPKQDRFIAINGSNCLGVHLVLTV
jgi:hypothetical protein